MMGNDSDSEIADCETTFLKDIHRKGFEDRKVIDVQIGQVKAARGDSILQSKAIGSCIGFVIYDFRNKVGVMSHIMFPGKAPPGCKDSEKSKYAENAVQRSMLLLRKLNGNIQSSAVFIVGAGNVLKRKGDTICRDNLLSIAKLLKKYNIKITGKAVGGTRRRSVFLDLRAGTVYYNEGDNKQEKLWSLDKAG